MCEQGQSGPSPCLLPVGGAGMCAGSRAAIQAQRFRPSTAALGRRAATAWLGVHEAP